MLYVYMNVEKCNGERYGNNKLGTVCKDYMCCLRLEFSNPG